VSAETARERAVLVHVYFPGSAESDAQDDLTEFKTLCRSAGAEVAAMCTAKRTTPDSRYYIGTGKTDELADMVSSVQADLVLFNHALSPSQERNLETRLKCRVLDRTGLILDIFAQRARTHEGKLQVELAQLTHLSTRLIRGWTHLERQRGGIGVRGPGESQLETDRRLIGARIKQLKQKLDRVRSQRKQSGRSRQRAAVPQISLAGYTNAGKSTLFNRLTDADVYVADKLFATLDPTLRRIDLPGIEQAVLADTVGFIRKLPHDLIESFQSTLEETARADLLLHVIDASDEARDTYVDQVNKVLTEIGAQDVPCIEVYNKIDAISRGGRVEYDRDGVVKRVWVSAQTGEGIELLQEAISETLLAGRLTGWLRVPLHCGDCRAKLYRLDAVLEESHADDGTWLIRVQLDRTSLDRILAMDEQLDFTQEDQIHLAGQRVAT